MLRRLIAASLDSAEVEQLVRTELADLLALCHPVKVFLFGSAARGEMTDASDLDLLVVLRDDEDLKAMKRRYYCRRKSHQYPVDIVVMHLADFVKKSNIGGIAMICRQEGRLLFEGAP